jgi:hypothetical protein
VSRAAANRAAAAREQWAGASPAGGSPAGASRPGAAPAGHGAAPPAGLNVGPSGGRSALNTGGLIYGTIVAAAAVAVGSGHGDTPGDIVDAMAATVTIYWLAHVYTAALSGRRPGASPRLRGRAWAAARHEAPILVGGVPLLVVVVALWVAGLSVAVMAAAALGTAIGVLALEGLLAGRQAGVRGWRLPVESLAAALFGAMIAVLMTSLHT